jgi:hypothetical protein
VFLVLALLQLRFIRSSLSRKVVSLLQNFLLELIDSFHLDTTLLC